MTDENILLNVAGLSAAVDEKVILHDVDLTVGAGETHVLMGPNGAGKSTLGHVVMGDPEYTVTGGKITFNGQDITDLSTDKRSHAGLFLSFQAPVEIPGVPVSSFLRAISAGRPGVGDMKGKQFRKHVKELAEELNMDPAYLDREPGRGLFRRREEEARDAAAAAARAEAGLPGRNRLRPGRGRAVRRLARHGGLSHVATARSSSSRTTPASWSTSTSTASTSWSRAA